jgi:hypothetical protein
MEIYFEKLYGDLARIGNFPERYFGWQAQRPEIPLEQLKDYPLADADVLVIGDSFSAARVWQSRLIADGLKVSTITWHSKIEALPSDLGEVLRAAGFKGRYLIIESIERLFQGRMKALANVPYPIIKNNVVIDETFPLYPFTHREPISFDKLNGADWGIKALYNSTKLLLDLPEKYLKSGAVQVIKLEGCQVFSHRWCHYALFVDGDFKKETFNAIDNVLAVNKNLQQVGIQPIWAIVPDKATVYLGYGNRNHHPYQNIWQQVAQHPDLIAPDLGAEFTQQSRIIKDFYMPNDTHLSTNGYLYLGDIMINELHKLQASQDKPQ